MEFLLKQGGFALILNGFPPFWKEKFLGGAKLQIKKQKVLTNAAFCCIITNREATDDGCFLGFYVKGIIALTFPGSRAVISFFVSFKKT